MHFNNCFRIYYEIYDFLNNKKNIFVVSNYS